MVLLRSRYQGLSFLVTTIKTLRFWYCKHLEASPFRMVVVVVLTLRTPCIVACQDPLSMLFPRQEYWSGLPFPSPEGLLHSGIKAASPALQEDSLPLSQCRFPSEWMMLIQQLAISSKLHSPKLGDFE